MSYIDNNLLPDEKIIFRTKKHYIIFLVPIIFLLLTLFFCTDNHITTNINSTLNAILFTVPFLKHITRPPVLFFSLVTIYVGFLQWLMYVTSDYAVTNIRVIMREGFFLRHVCDTRLSTVSHVTVDQNLLAQALNYGTIIINAFGGTRDGFIQIALPNEFQKAVQSQLEKRNS
jgi:uncharacterized membrane protein YdbT with pleckstrin-like domain